MICKNLLLLLLHARLYFTEGQADGVERVDFVKSESVSSIGVRGNHQESRNSHRQEDRELQSGMNFVVNFDLYDATLDAKVGNLTNGAVINLRELGISSPSALNIEAVVKGKTRPGSVKVFMEKFKYKQIQTLPPYTLCGISRKDYKQCTKLSLGTHTVQATVYSRTRARGSTLVVKTLSFTIVNDMPKPPTSGPTRSPTHLPTSSQIRSPTHKPTIAPTGSPTSMPAPPSVTCKIPMVSPKSVST